MDLHRVHLQWDVNRLVARHYLERACLDSCNAFSERLIFIFEIEEVKREEQVVLWLISFKPVLGLLNIHAVPGTRASLRLTVLKANERLLFDACDCGSGHRDLLPVDAQTVWYH